jgi:cytochrome c556
MDDIVSQSASVRGASPPSHFGDSFMTRSIRRAVSALTVGAAALVLAVSASAKPTADAWSTEDIMKKVNSKKGAVAKATAAVKDGKWEDAAKVSKDIKKGGEDLAKNEPHKGDKESWKKLTKTYGETTKAMSDAIDKKDKEAFEKAGKTLQGSCNACHDTHR